MPGFLEIDLVAHCGDTAEGQFVNTRTCVDVSTGRTECLAILPRTKQTVFSAIQGMRSQLPLAQLGIDLDKSTEFINDLLYHYCDYKKITFTRARPYHENDQAHVKPRVCVFRKKLAAVRRLIGYDRLDTQAQALLLQEIYQDLRLYVNFFQPVLKLVAKQHVDNKLIKRYDTAATPYQRVLASANVPLEAKARLTNLMSVSIPSSSALRS